MRKAPDEYGDRLINALTLLATLRHDNGTDDWLALIAEARTLAEERYGTGSLPVATVRSQAAAIHSNLAEYEQAEQEFEAVIPVYEAHLGRNHGETLSTINNLAVVYIRDGRNEPAKKIYRDVLQRYRDKYGDQHRFVANSYQNLATALTRTGRYAESIPLHQRAFDIYQSVLPQDQPTVAFPLLTKAFAEVHRDRFEDAESTARQAQEILERTGADEYLVGIAQCLVARAIEGQGRLSEGDEMLAESHASLVGGSVPDPYREFCRLPPN